MVRVGYNTNGFPHHRVEDVCELLAGLGYDAIAITPDVFHLDPFGDGLRAARELRARLDDLGLAVAIETGARFVLDPARKHRPTLLDEPALARRRVEYLERCFEIAEALGAETLSFCAGAAVDVDEDVAFDRLAAAVERLCVATEGSAVELCFEPEPGMLVASLADAERLFARVGGARPRLMLDIGHVPVTESERPETVLARWAPRLGGVQLDDCRGGRHEHLRPGDGEVDFDAVFVALDAIGFDGLACWELPRHAHDPVTTAREVLAFTRARAPRRG